MPNIFSAYADTAYTLEQMGQVVDLSPYLTEKEKMFIFTIIWKKVTFPMTAVSTLF